MLQPGKRAVRDEQKAARRLAILRAGGRLFASQDYAAVTMADVAEAAHLAKGTVYLYFATKEELFLALIEEQLTAWFAAVDLGLARLASPAEITEVARLLSDTVTARPELVRLLAILHPVLEQNVEIETARGFKRFLRDHVLATGERLESRLSFLAPGQGAALLLRAHALLIGLQHLTAPAPVVRQVLAEPGMELFLIDFASEFAATLRVLLAGMRATAPSAHDLTSDTGE